MTWDVLDRMDNRSDGRTRSAHSPPLELLDSLLPRSIRWRASSNPSRSSSLLSCRAGGRSGSDHRWEQVDLRGVGAGGVFDSSRLGVVVCNVLTATTIH